jgi:hypothetical protein
MTFKKFVENQQHIEIGLMVADAKGYTDDQINDAFLEKMGSQVVDQAREIFKKCGVERDFVIQHVGSMGAVFGGTNRLMYSPESGFRIDRGLCTSKFKSNWDDNYEKQT